MTENPFTNRIAAAIVAALEERHPDRLRQIRCSAETRLAADLELSSIDTIQVFAAVDARLGIQARYDRLLAGAEPVTDLSIGELARFISANGGDSQSSVAWEHSSVGGSRGGGEA